MLGRRLLALLVVIVLFTSFPRAQTSSYTFSPIQIGVQTFANGINAQGQIVGSYHQLLFPSFDRRTHGFLLDENGNVTTIDFPGDFFTTAEGINVHGQIVGINGSLQGYLLDDGVFTAFSVPGSSSTFPYGINNRGQIVGEYSDGSTKHGFLLDRGTFTTIDVPGAVSTAAYGINERGQIVGHYEDPVSGGHGFMLDGRTFTVFDAPGAVIPQPLGINNRGQIVGVGSGIFPDGVVFYRGTATPIEVPSGPNEFNTTTHPVGINVRGVIVGTYRDVIAQATWGFVAHPQ
jgi:hypothetical protein